MGLHLKLSKSKVSRDGYDLVVCQKHKGVGKKFIDKVGFLVSSPNKDSVYLVVNEKRFSVWLTRGVKISNRLRRLLVY